MIAAAPPVVDQMVVFRDGRAAIGSPGTGATHVRASGRSCRVPRATPLAALVRSEVARLRLRDFSGGCDPAGLFVRRIGPNRNHGRSGWVYKVGARQGTTGAADPSGPFGSGRIRHRARVTWFYCVFGEQGCQRTLRLRLRDGGGGAVGVRVTGHDDEGRGIPVRGAHVGRAVTDARGRATLALSPGRHRLHAEKHGFIRSFTERIEVG